MLVADHPEPVVIENFLSLGGEESGQLSDQMANLKNPNKQLKGSGKVWWRPPPTAVTEQVIFRALW